VRDHHKGHKRHRTADQIVIDANMNVSTEKNKPQLELRNSDGVAPTVTVNNNNNSNNNINNNLLKVPSPQLHITFQRNVVRTREPKPIIDHGKAPNDSGPPKRQLERTLSGNAYKNSNNAIFLREKQHIPSPLSGAFLEDSPRGDLRVHPIPISITNSGSVSKSVDCTPFSITPHVLSPEGGSLTESLAKLEIENDKPALSEPRAARFVFNASMKSDKSAESILEEVKRVLQEKKIFYTPSPPFCVDCLTDDIRFEIEICRVPRLSIYGLKLKRIQGDAWKYKHLVAELVQQLNLSEED